MNMKEHMNDRPAFLRYCEEYFDKLIKHGFEKKEEIDREGGLHFELTGTHLRLTLYYYPQESLGAEIGPNAIGTMRDRRNLLEVFKLINHPLTLPKEISQKNERQYLITAKDAALDSAVREWVHILSDAVITHLPELQDETDRRLKEQGPWRT